MTNDAMVAHVIASRLGPPPGLVAFAELLDVVAAVMTAFGVDPDAEFVPPEMPS